MKVRGAHRTILTGRTKKQSVTPETVITPEIVDSVWDLVYIPIFFAIGAAIASTESKAFELFKNFRNTLLKNNILFFNLIKNNYNRKYKLNPLHKL